VKDRLARAIVRLHPPAWRERYEDEVCALLAQATVRWRDVIDLARGLVVERARSVIEPGDRPALAAAVYWLLLVALRYLPGVVAAGVTLAAGLWLNRSFGPAPTWVVVGGFATFFVGGAWHHKWYWPANKAGISSNDRLPMPRGRRFAVLSMVFVGLGVVFWADPPEGVYQKSMWFYLLPGYMASQIRPRFTRSRQILWAFDALSSVKSQLKWAQMELDRCRILDAEGQAVPLAVAEADVRRLLAERDEVLVVLNRCGYRARFQR
jgi:hypothetical protein